MSVGPPSSPAPPRAPRTFPPGPMLAAVAILAVGKRLGLAKPIMRRALSRMRDEGRARAAFAGDPSIAG